MDPEGAAKGAGYKGDKAASTLLAQPSIKKALSEAKRYGAPINGLTREEVLMFLAGIVRDGDCGLRERLRAADQATKMEGWYSQKRTVEHIGAGGPSVTITLEDAKKMVRARNEEIEQAFRREFIEGGAGVDSICLEAEPVRGLGLGGAEPAKEGGGEVQGEVLDG